MRLAACAELRGNLVEATELRQGARRLAALSPRDAERLVRAAARGHKHHAHEPRLSAHLRAIGELGLRPHLEAVEARLPRDVAAWLRHRSREEVLAWHRRTGAITVADLRAACAPVDGSQRAECPLDDSLVEELTVAARALQPRLTLGRAMSLAEWLASLIAALSPSATLVPAGSLRRFEPTVGDLTFLIIDENPGRVLEAIIRDTPDTDIRHRSARAASLLLQREEVNLRAVGVDAAGCALVHYTGSPAHVRQLQARATVRGAVLTPQGLVDDAGRRVACETEADVYEALGLPYIPPELRHGRDEIDRAAASSPPALISVDHIRGDLHTHTLWSDGRDSTERIVQIACALGYSYVAITDHSPTARATRVLTSDRLQQQAVEIARLRESYPDVTILHGVEVDILPDGSLDFPDAVLAPLDLVLASLHEPGTDGPEQLLRRCERAMRHPLVNLITHPANRVPGRSEGYDLDWERLFALAADTGTALEVDGAPGHLDLDGHLARRAVAAGATLAIDSDGHFAERLGRQMLMGVGTARRGGVEPRHVLNARPLEDVRAFVAAKRRR